MPRLKFTWRRILAIVVLIVIIVAVGAVIYFATPAGTLLPEVEVALQSDDDVNISTENFLVFEPTQTQATTGFIFYPGGRVVPEAYAPVLREIANEGYLIVAVAMPLNLAVLNIDAANAVIEAFPDIQAWAVGGHSLGGSMAARFAAQNPDQIDGLVMWASYPEAAMELSARDDLAVASIYGTLDGLATRQQVEDSAQYLPSTTHFVLIEGGNHAYFGWYGAQDGDNKATISRDEQLQQVAQGTLTILEEIAE